LAIDLGTSGPKSALVSTHGDVIDHEFEDTDIILLPDGGAEQDPDVWWRAIVTSTRRLLDKKLVPMDDIIAVCCTTQWSGTVAVDRDGNHLMNAVIWLDSRGSKYINQIADGLIKIEGYSIGKLYRWLRLTGGAPSHSGKDPIGHILYIKNQLPEIYQNTYKFLEPKDYINLRFTGRFAASFESITLHWVTDNRDISNVTYDDKLLKISSIEREKLPDLKRAVDILGPIQDKVADELGLNRGIDVVMGTPDVQSAAIGSGAVGDYEGHLYIGTSCWITCHVPFKKTDLFHNMASLPSAIPDRYFVANEQETAGACFNSKWLLGYVEKFIKKPFDSINMIGGGANSNVWCQIFADVLDRTIKQVKNPIQANARGAAFLAAVSLGYMKFNDIPEHIQIENTYKPNPDNRKIYDELYGEFLNLYKCNRKIYARLNKK